MNASDRNAEERLALVTWAWVESSQINSDLPAGTSSQPQFDWLQPLRNWLDQIEVNSPELAHRLCRLIPAQCPFERTVKLFGRTLFHIPPLCKLNPVYDEVVALRFRALCYLADSCGEDISQYC
ncbi:MAG: Mo-dependent nitrogenase C-terminal domain-containing protein [Elainella sp.]